MDEAVEGRAAPRISSRPRLPEAAAELGVDHLVRRDPRRRHAEPGPRTTNVETATSAASTPPAGTLLTAAYHATAPVGIVPQPWPLDAHRARHRAPVASTSSYPSARGGPRRRRRDRSGRARPRPGRGQRRLTAELARVAREVVAVELAPRQRAQLQGRWENVRVVECDATAISLPTSPSASSRTSRSTAPPTCCGCCSTTRVPLTRADLIVERWGCPSSALPWPCTRERRALERVVPASRSGGDSRTSTLRARASTPVCSSSNVAGVPLVPERGSDEVRSLRRSAASATACGRRGRPRAHAVEARDLDAHRVGGALPQRRRIRRKQRGRRRVNARAGREYARRSCTR